LAGPVIRADLIGQPTAKGAAIPIEHFFADAAVRFVQIAPDGRHLAYLAALGNGQTGVMLTDLETERTEVLVGKQDESIGLFFWKGSDRIVYGGDLGGNESLSLRSINLKTRNVVPLAESFREIIADQASYASIEDVLKLDPKHILIRGNKAVGSYDYGIFLLDVRTGERRKVQGLGTPGTYGGFADNEGVIRALDLRVGSVVEHQVRTDGRSTLASRSPAGSPSSSPPTTACSTCSPGRAAKRPTCAPMISRGKATSRDSITSSRVPTTRSSYRPTAPSCSASNI
jgi:hypothetical protein